MLWVKRLLLIIPVLLVAGYAVLFTLKNGAQVDLDLFFVQFTDAPLDLIVLASFVLGGITGLCSSVGLFLAQSTKHRKALRKAERTSL